MFLRNYLPNDTVLTPQNTWTFNWNTFRYLTDVFPRVKLKLPFYQHREQPRAFLLPYFLSASSLINIFASSPRLTGTANSSVWKALHARQRSLLCTSICPFRWAYPWWRNYIHRVRHSTVNLKLSHHEYKTQHADCISICSSSVAVTHFCLIAASKTVMFTHTQQQIHWFYNVMCFHCDISSEDFYLWHTFSEFHTNEWFRCVINACIYSRHVYKLQYLLMMLGCN